MPTIIFRCPTTGMNAQAWFADDVSANNGETYESITCLACAQMHLVNRATGKTLGDDDGSVQCRDLTKSNAGGQRCDRMTNEAELIGGAFWGLVNLHSVDVALAISLGLTIIVGLVIWFRR